MYNKRIHRNMKANIKAKTKGQMKINAEFTMYRIQFFKSLYIYKFK